jgi:hypothetical protein
MPSWTPGEDGTPPLDESQESGFGLLFGALAAIFIALALVAAMGASIDVLAGF